MISGLAIGLAIVCCAVAAWNVGSRIWIGIQYETLRQWLLDDGAQSALTNAAIFLAIAALASGHISVTP